MTNSAEKSARFDLVIIGAGMAGLSLLHLLRSSIEQGLKVALVERFELPSLTNKDAGQDTERPPSFDGRATALSYGSQQIFSQLGVWSEIEAAACSIENIQVSDQGRFGQTHIKHTDANVESLGYIIRNRALGEGLIANLPQQLTILAPDSVTAIEITANQKASLTLAAGNTLDAELVVMADGGRSDLAKQLGIQQQSHRYNTHALVTSVRIDRSHKHWVRHLAETRHQFVQNCMHLLPALTISLVRQIWLVEVEIETLRTTQITNFTGPIWFS